MVFRQVHPNHWDGKNPNSVAFSPTPKDQDQLSVDDASLVTAEESWTHFTKNLGLQSVGVWAVTANEIASSGELALLRAPITGQTDVQKDNPAHCLIDFSKLTTKGQKKRCAQQLALLASVRGCQFQPVA
ncbi:hypothetical protein AW736_06420 [Termitidicoccus mucosus]|uniref:Uncharacterized protein n=2 Tax=Termitidicoccus mucosus TaxID=1184151 RepID=A0A178INF7_9BACT|nr:hypothetical protein AW736_06420 [Opitutaceae bacterium TSB47]